ncbi:MAG: ribonuclease III [Dethiosulfovibrio peptidovorans]|nr:MAG: ribonuclease III [Dethiosulfovibrio peptidovorans]
MYGTAWEADLSLFQNRLGYTFHRVELLWEALTHSSYAHESGLPFWNERLEFLGDAVLELVSSVWLYDHNPNQDEGGLTSLRSGAVCGDALYRWAVHLKLSDLIRVNRGLQREQHCLSPSIQADAVEALLGAVFLDGGYESACEVVEAYLNFYNREGARFPQDPKSRLQRYQQKIGGALPVYEVVTRKGPSHRLRFVVTVRIDDVELARGEGTSIKDAEMEAAAQALSKVQPVAP